MKPKFAYLSALAFVAGSLFVSVALAQSPPPATSPGAETIHSKTLWEQIKEGGWVMVPIGLCSIATLYLIGDGVIRTAARSVAPPAHEEAVKSLFRQGDYVGAYNFCKENPSPLTNVLRVGIRLLGDGKQIAEESMMGELAKENSKMQT